MAKVRNLEKICMYVQYNIWLVIASKVLTMQRFESLLWTVQVVSYPQSSVLGVGDRVPYLEHSNGLARKEMRRRRRSSPFVWPPPTLPCLLSWNDSAFGSSPHMCIALLQSMKSWRSAGFEVVPDLPPDAVKRTVVDRRWWPPRFQNDSRWGWYRNDASRNTRGILRPCPEAPCAGEAIWLLLLLRSDAERQLKARLSVRICTP